MSREKRRQLIFVLHREDRAGHVQKLTSGLEQGPQSLEKARLRRDEPTSIEEDRSMARLFQTAEKGLTPGQLLRLQAYYEGAILD